MHPSLLRLAVALFGAVLLATSAVLPATASVPEEVERRVADLLRRMTLEEKVGQLNLMSAGNDFEASAIEAGRVGAVINFNNARDANAVQALARRSRLGIPLLIGLDVLHGHKTMFPVPLAEAASFNPALARETARASALEAVADGQRWTYSPMVDVNRDPRWGRAVEGAGEDTYLGRAFAAARVEGYRVGGVAVGVKHFAGYGAAEGGRDYDKTDIPLAELRDVYLPPFRAAIEAGAETVMSAFNALNGVPAMANPWLLKDVLRGELGFTGFVTSDWAGLLELLPHGVAIGETEAARKGFLAGVEMDMAARLYDKHLVDEVRAGRVTEAAVDEAVRRVLRVKLALGLFEAEDPDPAQADAAMLTPEIRRIARQMSRESVVLLKNQGDVLPFGPATRRIAVVGSLADSSYDQLGAHAAVGRPDDIINLKTGILDRARAAGVEASYVPACDTICTTTDGFPAAVAAAREADVTVLVLGEHVGITGEAASRSELTFPGRQLELLDALAATGKPVVLLLIASRPLELGPVLDKTRAVVMTWFLGTEGGPAVGELLFGDDAPSGRLPVTWPKITGQIPLYYNRLPTGRVERPDNKFTNKYSDIDLRPQFPFGFGLGYTTFVYSDLEVVTPAIGPAEAVEVRVKLANTGSRAGQEVAQLYTRQPVASRSRPVRELKAFAKVALRPGEARTLTFRVPARELGFHREDGSYVIEASRFQVWVGGSAEADLGGAFEVTREAVLSPREVPGRPTSTVR